MVRRKLTIPERWQAVGMHSGGFSHRRVANHFRINHSIIVRLMQRFCQTGNVCDFLKKYNGLCRCSSIFDYHDKLEIRRLLTKNI
jgi:transposase